MAKRKAPGAKMPLKAEATAIVKAVATARYERKRNITEVIPPDVTRAKASAWLDLISPVTEWAGLKGDELRARRQLLRVQKEEALTQIALRAGPKLRTSSVKPIPNKFVVPFLEQASLEEPDSSLIDMWADLLVSASENFASYHTHFVSIMAQLSAKQGELLKKIVGTTEKHEMEIAQDNIRMWYAESRIKGHIYRSLFEKVKETREELSVQEVNDMLQDTFSQIGIDPVYVSFEDLSKKEQYEIDLEWAHFRDADEVDYAILEAVGLIRRVEAYFSYGEWEFELIYYYVTDLGAHFANSCGIVADSKSQVDGKDIPGRDAM
jgi:hypothetical protein